MSKETKHTPTPYRVERCHCQWPGCDKYLVRGPHQCDSRFDKADAEFIVRACNNFEPLLAACKEYAIIHTISNAMKAAIAEAEKQG